MGDSNGLQTDETNRARLASWVSDKLKEYDNNPSLATKRNAKYGSRGEYRLFLETTAAEKVVAIQRKRALVSDERPVPEGLEVRHTPEYGNALYTTRQFKRFDCILVEEPAGGPVKFNGTIFDEMTEVELEEVWRAQLETFCRMQTTTKQRVLNMFHVSLDLGGPSASLHARLQNFANNPSIQADFASILPPSHDHVETPTPGLNTIARVLLIFLSNACEWGGQHALPITGSLITHSCNANATRMVKSPSEHLVEYIARRDLEPGELVTIDYLGAKFWSRQQRRECLFASKRFVCKCPRCMNPDFETAMVCPECFPLPRREHGFCLPPKFMADSPSTAEDTGYIVQQSDDGTPEWVCTACHCKFSTEELEAIRLPEGAPAETYLGLSTYAEQMVEEVGTASLLLALDLSLLLALSCWLWNEGSVVASCMSSIRR